MSAKKASLKHRNGCTAHNESIRMSRENVDDCRLEIDVQDGGGGRKEKMSLGTIVNEFAMRFSVNQGFHCGWPEMSSGIL